MKNLNLLISALLLITLFSCEKDDTDDRDKFVGTWKGTGNLTVSGLGINISEATTQIVTKGTSNPNQIIFTESGVSTTANVNGNSYIYDDYSETETIEGETVTIKVTGTGSISGNVITEGGTIKVYMLGQEFSGTWSSTLNKQ